MNSKIQQHSMADRLGVLFSAALAAVLPIVAALALVESL